MSEKIVETKKVELTEKTAAALAYLQENDRGDDGYFGSEIAAATALNPQGIHGVMNSLVKKGLVAKGSKEAAFQSKDGTKGTKAYTTYFLTDAGRDFVISAE